MAPIRRWAWLCLLLAGPNPAGAHSPVPGIEGLYVGLIHPVSTPSQALTMVTSALLLASFDMGRARWLWIAFLIASLAGLLSGPQPLDIDLSLYGMAVVAGAYAALFPGRVVPLAGLILAVAGAMIGQASIPDDGPMRDRLFTMSGSMVGANLGLLYLYGISQIIRERYTWPWVAVAFRIAAAWLGAIALVMLALQSVQVPPAN